MNTNEPFDLRLPTPGCYLDSEKAGMDSDALFKGMTSHLFFTLGKLATSASHHDLYMALSYAVKDAHSVRSMMIDQFGFPEDNVISLSNELSLNYKV